MTDIQYNEPKYRPKEGMNRKSLLVRMVLASGVVSTDDAAQYVLLTIAILGLVASAVIVYVGSAPTGLSSTDIERITQLQQGAQQPP